ncbi:MAG: hypothetical protein D6705_06140 [Deltaproteobacteria bacterium]|nr:MAG: hypothetical protein D6705_06140 [Deltaproteobacteria bacterium]
MSKAVRNMPQGIQENVPDRGPPESFESPEAERKWYEAALERAREELAFRQKAVERLEKARDEIDKASDPAAARATFERRREIVEQNLQRAQERVAELERKLESLGSAP